MVNKNYQKGRNKEYKIVNSLKSKGYLAQRTAGSHSPIDVLGINVVGKEIYLIQAKPDSMSDKEKNKIKKENEALNGFYLVSFQVI